VTELIREAQQGNAEAFIALMDSQRQTMYKVARGYLREHMDIDDAIAETVLSCWESIGTLHTAEYFRTWLVRILVNKCTDLLRQRRRSVPLETVGERAVSGGFERTEFDSLIDCLDEQYRAIFILYYSEGFRIREISGILGIPEGTVGSRLQRGREQLRRTLEKGGV